LFPDTCNVDAGPPLLLEELVLVEVLPELLVVPLEELAVPPPPPPPVLDELDADELLLVVPDPPLAPAPALDEPEAPAPLAPVLVAVPPHAETIVRQEKATTRAVRTETSRMRRRSMPVRRPLSWKNRAVAAWFSTTRRVTRCGAGRGVATGP
jgi:hypothetical protein